jgi:Na+/H+ antiporter NhaC
MLGIILTIFMVGAFFILFFKTPYNLKNKKEETETETETKTEEVSSTVGFVEDTGLDSYGSVFEKGDMGSFVPYSTIPEDSWLSGSPHLKEIINA